MSLMCSLEGCKEKKGLCVHEKAMMIIVLVAVAGLLVWKFV